MYNATKDNRASYIFCCIIVHSYFIMCSSVQKMYICEYLSLSNLIIYRTNVLKNSLYREAIKTHHPFHLALIHYMSIYHCFFQVAMSQ